MEAGHPERAHWTKLPRTTPSFGSNGEVLWENEQVHLDFPSCCISALLAIMQNYQHVLSRFYFMLHGYTQRLELKAFLLSYPLPEMECLFLNQALDSLLRCISCSYVSQRVDRKWLLDSNIYVNQWNSRILSPLAEQNMPTPSQKWAEIYFGGRKAVMG